MPMAAGSKVPPEWAGKFPIMRGVKPEEWDGYHDFVIHDELMRVGCIGYVCSDCNYHFRYPLQPATCAPTLIRIGSARVPNGLIGGVVCLFLKIVIDCDILNKFDARLLRFPRSSDMGMKSLGNGNILSMALFSRADGLQNID
jgi:hypothetical protein